MDLADLVVAWFRYLQMWPGSTTGSTLMRAVLLKLATSCIVMGLWIFEERQARVGVDTDSLEPLPGAQVEPGPRFQEHAEDIRVPSLCGEQLE